MITTETRLEVARRKRHVNQRRSTDRQPTDMPKSAIAPPFSLSLLGETQGEPCLPSQRIKYSAWMSRLIKPPP